MYVSKLTVIPSGDFRGQLIEEALGAREVELLPQLSQGLELGRHDDTRTRSFLEVLKFNDNTC